MFWTTSRVSLWCWWSSRVIFMQTVQDLAPDPDPALIITRHGRLWIIKITRHGIMGSCTSPPRVIAASSMFKFTFSNLIYVWQKRNVYGVCAITICLFVTHFIIFTLPSTGQLPSVNCCNILIQIVLFVIYTSGFHYNSTILGTTWSFLELKFCTFQKIIYLSKKYVHFNHIIILFLEKKTLISYSINK